MKYENKAKAIALRKQGWSYGEIGSKLGVSKSTLSGWLADVKLSPRQIKILSSRSSVVRAEKVRTVKAEKKKSRLEHVFSSVARDIEQGGVDFVSGFYLYWGEGTKTAPYTVSLTNSDPAIIVAFLKWLALFNVSTEMVRAKLHLYRDQNDLQMKTYWSRVTSIPIRNFNKSYVKDSRSIDKTYKGMFGNGTCVVAYHNRDVHEYILQGIEYLRKKYQKL
jgi:transposase-like protein